MSSDVTVVCPRPGRKIFTDAILNVVLVTLRIADVTLVFTTRVHGNAPVHIDQVVAGHPGDVGTTEYIS